MWAANLGTITFHPWPVRREDVDAPDELRLDFDPQPGADFDDCVTVALAFQALLDELGWIGFPKTSGGRGVHVYVRIEPRWTFTDVRHAAIAIGRELERRLPDLVTVKWWKEERPAGQRLRGLQPEQPRPHHRLRLVGAGAARRAGVHPGDLGGAAARAAVRLHGPNGGARGWRRRAIRTPPSTRSSTT